MSKSEKAVPKKADLPLTPPFDAKYITAITPLAKLFEKRERAADTSIFCMPSISSRILPQSKLGADKANKRSELTRTISADTSANFFITATP